MITVRFFRIRTHKIQKFDNVFSIVAQRQDYDDAYYSVNVIEDGKIQQIKIPMNDSYINGVF